MADKPAGTADAKGEVMSSRLLVWLGPSLVVGVCSVAFSVGLYVGRAELAADLAQIRNQVENHSVQPRHAGAVSSEVLELRFGEINSRLDRLEDMIERLDP